MRLSRLTRVLILIPAVTGVISTVLLLVQGGFGGGHSTIDFVITALGFPSILLIRSMPLPSSVVIPDILLVVWFPALLNMVGLLVLGSILTKTTLLSSKG